MIPVKPLAMLCFVLAVPGCALLSKGEANFPRYFSPDLPEAAPKAKAEAPRPRMELRLGRVTAGSYLGEKIVFRESEQEVGFYDNWLWTERPEIYLRRALTRMLFEEEELTSVVSGPVPSLDVELVRFEEVRRPRHAGLVRVAFALQDYRSLRLQQTLTIERPIVVLKKGGEADAVARALGEALRSAIHDVTERVIRDLSDPAHGMNGTTED